MTERVTTEMGRYIWKILLGNAPVSMCWGIDMTSIRQVDNGISLHVQGLKLKGTVEIVYDEASDYFNVSFVKDGDATEKETMKGIAFDELVRIIDERVEYTGADYMERIKREYGIS